MNTSIDYSMGLKRSSPPTAPGSARTTGPAEDLRRRRRPARRLGRALPGGGCDRGRGDPRQPPAEPDPAPVAPRAPAGRPGDRRDVPRRACPGRRPGVRRLPDPRRRPGGVESHERRPRLRPLRRRGPGDGLAPGPELRAARPGNVCSSLHLCPRPGGYAARPPPPCSAASVTSPRRSPAARGVADRPAAGG